MSEFDEDRLRDHPRSLLEEMFDLLPPLPNEDKIVQARWPALKQAMLSRIQSASIEGPPSNADAIFERTLGRSDDDSPLPDFVARRLPPIADTLATAIVEVWVLDSRFLVVERLAGLSAQRGALARWEGPLESSGLLPRTGPSWRSFTMASGSYEPAPGDVAGLVSEHAQQVVVALREDDAVFGYLRAVFSDGRPVDAEKASQLRRVANVLKYAVFGSECRRIERARNELSNLGNRVTDAQVFLGEIVTEFLPRVLSVQAASVFFVNEAGDGLVLARSTGIDEAGARVPLVYRMADGLTGHVWQHKRSLRFPDDLSVNPKALEAYEPPPRLAALSRERLPPNARRQFLAVPLMRDREVIGVLRLGGRTGEWRFSEWDEALANAIAAQIVQIYSHLRVIGEGIEAKATLIKAMELLQSAQTEEEMIRITLIALTCRRGLGFNRAAFWSFDEDSRSLTPSMVIGAETAEEDQSLRARVAGPLEQVVKAANGVPEFFRTPLYTAFRALQVDSIDSGEDCLSSVCREPSRPRATAVSFIERWGLDPNEKIHAAFKADEARVVPVLTGGSCIGCIYVDNAFDRSPIRDDLEQLLLAHARHLAGAVKALRESAQRRLAHDFHRRLSSALVAPGDTFSVARGIVSAIHDVLGFDRILIYCHDTADGVIRLLGSHGFGRIPVITFQAGKMIRAIVPKVVQSRRPYFTELAEDDPQIDAEWKTMLELRGPLLAFPLQLGGLITGVLVLNDARVNPGTEFALQTLADMLGVAVRTIAQDERLEAREKTVGLLRRIQKDLRLANNEEAFAGELAASLIGIIPGQLCALYRPLSLRAAQDPRSAGESAFGRRGSAGYPESLREAVKIARKGLKAGLTSHVLCGETLNVPHVEKDPRSDGSEYSILTEILGGPIRAFIGVPLLASDGRVLGAITLTRLRMSVDDGLAFQNHERDLLDGIAQGVSTVLELKDARTLVEDHLAKMDAVNHAYDRLVARAVAVRSLAELDQLRQEIIDEFRRVCDADLAALYWYGQSSRQLSPSLSGDFWRRDAVEPAKVPIIRGRQRVVAEYHEDAVVAYGGSLPKESFAEREGVVSFAEIVVCGAGDELVLSLFVSFRKIHRFSSTERQMIERFAANCGVVADVAASGMERAPRGLLRVIAGGSSTSTDAVGASARLSEGSSTERRGRGDHLR